MKMNEKRIVFILASELWFDLGTQEQLKEASSWLLSQK